MFTVYSSVIFPPSNHGYLRQQAIYQMNHHNPDTH